MSEPKKQHAVAQFHLRNWCSSQDNKLQAYRWLPNGALESKRRGPAEVCRELHLYSLRTADKDFKYLVENTFQKLETLSAPIAEKLLNDTTLTSEERSVWTCYLLAQRVRVKTALADYIARCQPIIEGKLDQIQSEYKASAPITSVPKSIIDVLKENIPGLVKNVPMLSMLDFLVDGGPHQDILMNMKWRVVDISGSKHKLLTSDQPIIYTAGLKESYAEVVFPLTPSKVFIACNSSSLKKASKIVLFCNEQIARNAQNDVIAYDDTQRVFIERRLVKNSIINESISSTGTQK